jgi:hypothetical protein
MDERIVLELQVSADNQHTASELTSSLLETLKGSLGQVEVTLRQAPEANTGDPSNAIVAGVGTQTISEFSKIVGEWLAEHQSAEVTVKRDDTVIVKKSKSGGLLNMLSLEFEVSAENENEASRLTGSLLQTLNGSSRRVKFSRHRAPNSNTQDPGTILLAILATKSAIELSKSLGDWLVKNQSAEITVKKDGTVIVKNAKSRDLLKILEKIFPSGA